MARIENTVFISYRRTDVYTALAVYENLKNQGYDVFFDYRSISSGDFSQIITANIKARAHFLLILTPTTLDRCNEPGDWLRREIELAIDEKRNIVPLFFKGFRFGAPNVKDKLTGTMQHLSRYNALNVHEDYFDEAMQRLRSQYLNIPLDTILHPVSNEVQKVVVAEQVAADKALEQIEDVQQLVKRSDDSPVQLPAPEPMPKLDPEPIRKLPEKQVESPIARPVSMPGQPKFNLRLVGGIAGGVLALALIIWGGFSIGLGGGAVSAPTRTSQPLTTKTPTVTETSAPPTPALGIGSTMTGNDGMILLYVPVGEFTMGGDNGADDEKPVHKVALDAFWIDKTEVTNAMYAKCVVDGICNTPSSTKSAMHDSYYGNPQFNNFPVVYVNWNMAKTYCEWAGRRLPTEAEWEKAARGTDGREYPWGNGSPYDSLLNMGTVGDTTEVGTFPEGASPYGALDMAGNVLEWVADWYAKNYYSYLITSNPLGPASGTERVLRGYPWESIDGGVVDVSSHVRTSSNPMDNSNVIGFRCAMDATP